jgi:Tol biopolymer transport system component
VLVKAPSATSFAVGQNGTLAYVSGELPSELRTLIWLDRAGNETAITAPPRTYRYPRLSPDGHRLAVDVSDQQRDIWIWDFAQLNLTRFTFGAGVEQYPVWSPDGRRIAFGTGGLLAWAASDGSGSVESLTKTGSSGQVPYGFTPDGKTLIVRGSGVSAVSIHDGKSVRIADGMNGEPSPDGRWLAYQSQESGNNEIVVRPFPAVDQGRWQVSTSGGTHPRWARNGRELFYLSPDNNLMRVPVQAGESFVYGAPDVLLRNVPVPSLSTGRPYDVAPGGQRFLFIKTASVMPSGADLLRLQVVLNWAATLTARASPP